MIRVGATVAGYRIDGVLGQGGMGHVYAATQLSLRRTVALKVLAPELGGDPRFRQRFRREALAQATLDNPNVLAIYETFEAPAAKPGEPPELCIAMQLVRGATLKELIRAGALTPERSIELLRGVAAALAAAHAHGLVHRDVKPSNILVSDDERVFLGDFGIARIAGETTLTATGELMGTLWYASPEVLDGRPATPASDVYALAAVLYECLCGAPPFEHDTPSALVSAHLSAPPPLVTARCPDLPGALDEVLARGLAKDPRQRPDPAALIEQAASALAAEHSLPAHAAAARGEAATVLVRETTTSSPGRAARRPQPVRPPRRLRSRRGVLVAAGGAAVLAGVAIVALVGGGEDNGRRGPNAPAQQPVTLGSDLRAPGTIEACTGGGADACTAIQTALPGGTVAAPFNGVVVRWRVRADGRVRLVVVRGGARKAAIRASAPEQVSRGETLEVDSRLALRAGDLTGLQLEDGARLGIAAGAARGARLERFSPPLGPQPAGDPSTGPDDAELLLSADLEPDSDGDGFGDVSQDRCPRERGSREGCESAG